MIPVWFDFILIISCSWRNHIILLPMFAAEKVLLLLVISLTADSKVHGDNSWGPSGADRTQVGPMLAPWTLLSGTIIKYTLLVVYIYFLIHIEFRGVFWDTSTGIQYIPRNMHTVFALLCFVVVLHWLILPYPSGLLHWHCGNLTIAPVPAKQPWWIWINTSCEFIMNDCITTTKQNTTKPCAYFLGYTVHCRYYHDTEKPKIIS